MTRLEWSERALSELDQLVLSHHLPPDTRDRIESSARPLERFPRFGPEIGELPDGAELRFLIGPWPWLVIVYLYLEAEDRIGVVAIEDGRAATSTITRGRERPPLS
jgi:plasmid stabilization system protein ParE